MADDQRCKYLKLHTEISKNEVSGVPNKIYDCIHNSGRLFVYTRVDLPFSITVESQGLWPLSIVVFPSWPVGDWQQWLINNDLLYKVLPYICNKE